MNARATAWIFHGETRIDAIPAGDRGLAYGDGLFETMRVHCGSVWWWDAHWRRLAQGAQRLRLELPRRQLVEAQVAALCAGVDDAVLKLTLTRGSGDRGYAPPTDGVPVWMLSCHSAPSASRSGGLHLRWCTTRLAIQPVLAGLKHCNRLEQVLARGEWSESGIDEGLMRCTEGDVVCATAANLFVLRAGRWWTPPVDRCGVAGICREWMLQATGAGQARLLVSEVEAAEAVVLCNAVRGILRVARLGDRTWPPHAEVQALRQRLAAAHPAFTTSEDNT